MSVRGVAVAVAFVAASGASAGERRAQSGVEVLPLLPPPAIAARSAPPAAAPAQRAVCVRLCDGYFFPLSENSAGDAVAACRALCPASGVALYFLPGGSDRIEDAADASGAPYTALPAAFRYRRAGAPTCGCRSAGDSGLAYWQDPTLRRGDAIMTEAGVVVFVGGVGGAPYRAEAFQPVDAAPLGATRRAELDGLSPALAPLAAESSAGIGEARRAAGGEIRFLAAPPRDGG